MIIVLETNLKINSFKKKDEDNPQSTAVTKSSKTKDKHSVRFDETTTEGKTPIPGRSSEVTEPQSTAKPTSQKKTPQSSL